MRGQAGFFDVDERLKQLSAKGDSLERLASSLRKTTGYWRFPIVKEVEASKYFLFRAIPAFASFEQSIPIIDDLLTCPWQRVGQEPIILGRELKRS